MTANLPPIKVKPRPRSKHANKSGRSAPKVTDAIVEQVAELQAKGMTRLHACALAGINYKTFHAAIERHPEWREAIDLAQARFTSTALDQIASGVKHWTALAWILERTQRAQFGRQAEVQVQNAMVVGFTEKEMQVIQAEAKKFLERKPKEDA
jgi:hypothetical protein